MQISYKQNNPINFSAKVLNQAQISKFNIASKSYIPQKVSIAEMEPSNFGDLSAIFETKNDWSLYEKYASNIAYTAHCLFNNTLNREKSKVLVITKQLDNLKDLNSKDILGMADIKIKDKKFIEINYIQVDPNINSDLGYPKPYKKVGTRIIDTLKTLYDKIELTAAKGSVKDFYIKNGFICVDSKENKYHWEKTF